MIANPLVPSGEGYLYRAETLTFDDLEISKYRQNVARQSVQLNGTMEYYPSDNTTVAIGGNLDYRRFHDYIPTYGLMNYNNNPLYKNSNYNVWGRFRQTFGSSTTDSTVNLIKNAYYQLQFDYTVFRQRYGDDTHWDNFFRYGHVGNFPYYNDYVQATTTNNFGETNYFYERDGANNIVRNLQGDTLGLVPSQYRNIYVNTTGSDDYYGFNDSEYNPDAARYISHYQEINGGSPISFPGLFQDGLFFNGGRARLIHSLWFGPGREFNGYGEINEEQYRLSGMAGADIGKHAITFGFEHEQRVRTTYTVSPLGLWFLAESQANFHLGGFDLEKGPEITYDDATNSAFLTFDNVVDPSRQQTTFDRNLRERLGFGLTEEINIYDINPDDMSIDMFGADELLRFGYADWIGYDHTGKRTRGQRSTFQDFFYDTINRAQAPFQPIYSAFFLQDKFEINDLILRLGVRVDRYDANQVVMKDKYSTVYLDKVSETDLTSFRNGDIFTSGNISSLIQDDWVIYVNQNSESFNGSNQGDFSVVGFRQGDNWYDTEGNRVRDYLVLFNTNPDAPNNARPWFTYADQVNREGANPDDKKIFDRTKLDVNGAFEDFKARYNVMPRVSFSFPVNEMATFFANYDVLTQRPDPNRTRVRPSDFYFLNQFQFVNNPDLKPQRQVSYQLGFKQALDKKQTVAMTLSAAYQERKDEIQIVQVNHAYPGAYTSFDNIDFSTVKRGEISFDTRRINNVQINANYTISFADGTGSGATTAFGLISQGLGNIRVPSPLDFDQRHAVKLNLDYRLDSGKGPVMFGRKMLQGAGASLQLYTGSGTPYTRFATSQISEVFIGVAGRTQLSGGINSSNLPWQNRINLRLYKNLAVNGRKDALNIYFYVQNLLNTRNIINVYKNTGSPDDDGFMYIRQDADVLSAAERDMYFARLTAPNWNSNYGLPRMARVGLMYNF
jgi:hypothetical protein